MIAVATTNVAIAHLMNRSMVECLLRMNRLARSAAREPFCAGAVLWCENVERSAPAI
jgi:hypothetical protein